MGENDRNVPSVSGFINLYKPRGGSSFNCIRFLRKILKTRKIGHIGTLDPLAEGVLPMAVGYATRLIEYIPTHKIYVSVFQLGITTNTDDIEGEVIDRIEVPPFSEPEIIEMLREFEGDVEQVPPAVSAVHVNGQRAYKIARTGMNVQLTSRLVRIHSIKLLNYQHPFLTLEIESGPGTYIRSIARDLGEKLKCGAVVSELRRTRSGPFFLNDSLTVDQVRELVDSDQIKKVFTNIHEVVDLPIIYLNDSGKNRISNGGRISLEDISGMDLKNKGNNHSVQEKFAAVSSPGNIAAVVRQEEQGIFIPEKVFAAP
jgi:tRNA pseudouridine55 synthase